ncbi:DUF423 domain-containing protein [Vibrio metschnikovii]|uniref:DUF423 domain-containing protein n=1 Tax=Vibrio metschnikovii TaxID=28172 RepID=UPI001C2F825B|nr:DUF423 domain-containing protein [Vibrio metschnikovii]
MKSSQSLTLIVGGLVCGISVALGAFTAHGLKAQLTEYALTIFQTAAHYQFMHGLAIIACGLALGLPLMEKSRNYFGRAAICFIIGIFCFSGSLYLLALTGVSWIGFVTPIGGLLFLLGWCMFVLAAINIKEVRV